MIGSKRNAYVGSSHGRPVGEPGSSHGYMIAMIGSGKRVLEFGCASGYMSEVLARAGCSVTGIDIDPKAAAAARASCEEVVVADLDVRPLVDLLPGTPFDVAVFGDVLEHLRDPWKVLDDARAFIGAQGFAVISVPNVAHGSVRLALLRGNFDYSEEGLLDDTHLRFFTLKSLRELCLRAGYRIEQIERTKVPVFEEGSSHPRLDRDDFDPAIVAMIEADPEHDTLQFVVRAVPLDDETKFAFVIDRCIENETLVDDLRRKLERALSPDANVVTRLRNELSDAVDALASATDRATVLELETKQLRAAIEQLEAQQSGLESRVADRERVAESLRAEREELETTARAQRAQSRDLGERLERERAALAETEHARRAIAESFASHLREEVERVRIETAQIDAEIRAIQSSRWWRIKTILGTLRGVRPT